MAAPTWLLNAVTQAADRYRLPRQILINLIRQESGFQPQVVSPAGAIGLTQLMPGTAAALGVNPHDPVANIIGGAHYLRQQLDRFGSLPLALAAYNAGPNAVAKYGGIPPYTETQAYVRSILNGMPASLPTPTSLPAVPQAVSQPMRAPLQPQAPVPRPLPPLLSAALLAILNQTNALLGLPRLPTLLAQAGGPRRSL